MRVNDDRNVTFGWTIPLRARSWCICKSKLRCSWKCLFQLSHTYTQRSPASRSQLFAQCDLLTYATAQLSLPSVQLSPTRQLFTAVPPSRSWQPHHVTHILIGACHSMPYIYGLTFHRAIITHWMFECAKQTFNILLQTNCCRCGRHKKPKIEFNSIKGVKFYVVFFLLLPLKPH